MPNIDRQQAVLNVLQALNNLDGLKRLFWQELNYERENRPLSPRQWPESARQPLAEDPILFASGGEDNAFHIVYCRLKSEVLLRGHERPVVNCLTREHPYGLFVFSNKLRTEWHFINVKYDENAEKRRLLRRISVRPAEGLRTATERLQMLDLETISPDLFALSPLTIQQRHDDAFDVEKVTKDFYREVANWYFWALKHPNVSFPRNVKSEQDQAVFLIRLLTRLIFCWFTREKGLIPDTLFDNRQIGSLLKDTSREAGTYYKAILQNLFFATLNQESDKRRFRKKHEEGRDGNRGATNLYRYADLLSDPDGFLAILRKVPFINGGLFDCLDTVYRKDEGVPNIRMDDFSEERGSVLCVPNELFFGSPRQVDLNALYGDKKHGKETVRGLIHTLSHYQFTVEENTPFDQSVALDPELLGKVFENLLASYNPETGTTARKATGSFYTPREIVDYMVDESLIAYLKGKLTTECTENTEKKLRELLAYDAEMPKFSESETEALITGIDSLKALDPAVGSGAFPMGMLHKLVHVLARLDPGNERWKAKQIAKLDDAVMREDAERIFRENYDDYGRKLYLIENCIYGVDIQPIAVQIAKMRFFISLIVDQKVNPNVPNLDVRALPNLETKFVAANSLIGIDKPKQMLLRNPEIDKKEAELRKIREKHFTARTLKSKARCREDDKRLRSEIAELLKHDGWNNTTAKQLAAWDPYDQNAHAEFFEPEWMFGVTDGFDVVLGNPPYKILTKNNTGASSLRILLNRYDAIKHSTSKNLFVPFIELGIKTLIKPKAVLSYIVPEGLFKTRSYEKCKTLMFTSGSVRKIVTFKDYVFLNAITGNLIFLYQHKVKGLTEKFHFDGQYNLHPVVESDSALLSKIMQDAHPLESYAMLFKGMVIQNRNKVLVETQSIRNPDVFLLGKNIAKWSVVTKTYTNYENLVIIGGTKRRDKHAHYPRILIRRTGDTLCCAFLEEAALTESTLYSCWPITPNVTDKFLLALLNSKLMNFYNKNKFITNQQGFPQVLMNDLKLLPIRLANNQITYIELVTRILAAKQADPAADTSALEREIDEQVYKLYGLTEEEIAIVEGISKDKRGEK